MHETDTMILIGLETESKAVSCPACESAAVVGYGKMTWRVHDLPIEKKTVVLEIKRRRLRCRDCLITFNEPVGQIAAGHRATARLVQSVWKMALRRPFTALSKSFGMNEKTIRNIFKDTFDTAANQFKLLPHPPAPSALAVHLPVILRRQRVVWINLDQGTLIDLNEEATPQAIDDTLQRVARDGAERIYVPPDAALITTLQAVTRSTLILHAATLRAACQVVIDLGHSMGNAISYVDTLAQLVRASSQTEASRLWQDLLTPPPDLQRVMQPLLAAAALLPTTGFDAFGQPDHACDELSAELDILLRTAFTRRSYDVICAIVLFDKTLQKTARTGVAMDGAHLGYQKFHYGTSIAELVLRLGSLNAIE
jgi:transposase-like protein